MIETTLDHQISGLSEEARLLFAAGLAKLAEDMTERHPLLATINTTRAALVAGTVLTEIPEHVSFSEPDLQEMLSYVSDSQYWTVFWETSELQDGRYDLVGEVESDGDIVTFQLAEGLEGSTGFFLSSEDAAFVERIRAYVRLWQPSTTDELSVSIVEIPISWAALDGVVREGENLETYLNAITSPSGISGVMTRGARGDVHSNTALEEAEYAGVTTLAVDTPCNLAALPAIIAAYEESLAASPSPSK
jgi:hypothetical protein